MITRNQLRIYRTYGGDTDMLHRGSHADIKTLTTGNTWNLIKELVHAARRLECDPLPPAVAADLAAYIDQHTADDAARRLLRQLGRAYPHIRPPWLIELGQMVLVAPVLAIVGIPWLLLDKFRKR